MGKGRGRVPGRRSGRGGLEVGDRKRRTRGGRRCFSRGSRGWWAPTSGPQALRDEAGPWWSAESHQPALGGAGQGDPPPAPFPLRGGPGSPGHSFPASSMMCWGRPHWLSHPLLSHAQQGPSPSPRCCAQHPESSMGSGWRHLPGPSPPGGTMPEVVQARTLVAQ